MWLHSLKAAQPLRSTACLHTNQSRSYLNHLVFTSACLNPLEQNTSIGFFRRSRGDDKPATGHEASRPNFLTSLAPIIIVCNENIIRAQCKKRNLRNSKYKYLQSGMEGRWRKLRILLGVFAKLRKATISSVMSVRPSVRKNSARTGRNLIFAYFFRKSVGKIQVSLQSDKNSGYFT